MIYFASIYLNQTVHVQALGFTKFIMVFSEGETKDEAHHKVVKHLLHYKLDYKTITLSPALNQQKNSYTFPECIL